VAAAAEEAAGVEARRWFHGVMRTAGGEALEKLMGGRMEGKDYTRCRTDGADWIGAWLAGNRAASGARVGRRGLEKEIFNYYRLYRWHLSNSHPYKRTYIFAITLQTKQHICHFR
jgi:hypothetical protein